MFRETCQWAIVNFPMRLLIRSVLCIVVAYAVFLSSPRAFGWALPPSVSSVFPIFPFTAYQGGRAPTVIIYGSNFQSGATCSVSGGVTVNSCIFNSPTQLTADVQVSPTAAVGGHDVTVVNPDGQSRAARWRKLSQCDDARVHGNACAKRGGRHVRSPL